MQQWGGFKRVFSGVFKVKVAISVQRNCTLSFCFWWLLPHKLRFTWFCIAQGFIQGWGRGRWERGTPQSMHCGYIMYCYIYFIVVIGYCYLPTVSSSWAAAPNMQGLVKKITCCHPLEIYRIVSTEGGAPCDLPPWKLSKQYRTLAKEGPLRNVGPPGLHTGGASHGQLVYMYVYVPLPCVYTSK